MILIILIISKFGSNSNEFEVLDNNTYKELMFKKYKKEDFENLLNNTVHSKNISLDEIINDYLDVEEYLKNISVKNNVTKLDISKIIHSEGTTTEISLLINSMLIEWDLVLNEVYFTCIANMNEHDADYLKNIEQEWLYIRDITAKKNYIKNKNNMHSIVAYNSSLLLSTVERAIDLCKVYTSKLSLYNLEKLYTIDEFEKNVLIKEGYDDF